MDLSKKTFDAVYEQLNVCLQKHIKTVLLPELVECMKAHLIQARLDGKDEVEFVARVPSSFRFHGIFENVDVDVPKTLECTLADIKSHYKIPQEMRNKARNQLIQLFMSELPSGSDVIEYIHHAKKKDENFCATCKQCWPIYDDPAEKKRAENQHRGWCLLNHESCDLMIRNYVEYSITFKF